jgi:hypothetical protein
MGRHDQGWFYRAPIPDTEIKIVDIEEGTREMQVGEEGSSSSAARRSQAATIRCPRRPQRPLGTLALHRGHRQNGHEDTSTSSTARRT